MADVRSVAVGFWVGTGSRDEPDELAGASHFLEHLLFKGTPTRSAAAIAEALDEVGGDCNAFTTKEYTTFYIRLLAEHLPLGLDILSEIMWDPALRPSDVDAERTVILDEILMHADEPADLVAERWQSLSSPATRSGATPWARRRASARSALPTSGASSSTTTARATWWCRWPATATTRRWPRTSSDASPAARGSGPGRGPPRRPRPSRCGGATADRAGPPGLGMRSVSRFDERRWALAVLNHVLGGGLSSRLFQKVREQRGLAYSIWSERAAYQDTGSLAVVAGTAPEHVDEVLRIVTGELELLAGDGVTERELAVAKGNLRAELLLSGEDSGARMSRIGASLLLHGEVPTVDELLARIDAVEPPT